ncbi:MAG: Fpg/Nei family DNA glycosylase [bacterium]
MPELPDLVYLEKQLNSFSPGKKIAGLKIKEPIVFRILVPDGVEAALTGSRFEAIRRHGPFLCFTFDAKIELICHFMLAGRLQFISQDHKPARGLCCTFELDDAHALHYLDDKKMGKLYVVQAGDYERIPKFLQQGLDILSDDFTLKAFAQRIHKRRHQVRVFLMDQTVLSAIGNAYADEILFHARIHPKTTCNQLNTTEIERLFSSTRQVMQWGIQEVEKAQQPIEVKVRGHLKVRNRANQPCPECGTTIRRTGVLGHDSFFCPACQPARRRQFIDWT